jgi:hypothetical protein
MQVIEAVRTLQYDLRRKLRVTPVFQVFRELQNRGVRVEKLNGLELFAKDGKMHTADYYPLVKSLEAWEIKAEYEEPLRRNLPGAAIRIVDSYEEIQTTNSRFSLVVADTWTRMFDGHCEHFELFPSMFRVMEDECHLLLNVMPHWKVERFGAEHEKRRKEFYRRDDVRNVPLEWMVRVYSGLAADNAFEITSWFCRDRYVCHRLRPWLKCRLCYLMLSLHRMANDRSRSRR